MNQVLAIYLIIGCLWWLACYQVGAVGKAHHQMIDRGDGWIAPAATIGAAVLTVTLWPMYLAWALRAVVRAAREKKDGH